MSKKQIMFYTFPLVLFLHGCGNVDNSVDNSCITSENTVETMGNAIELSTYKGENEDNSVDNYSNIVDITEDNEEYTTWDEYEQAEYYYYYYATMGITRGLQANIVYSKNSFKLALEKEKGKTLEDYYSITGWYDRGEYYSLQFVPNPSLFAENCDNVYQWMARCIKGYMLAKEKYSEDELWKHEDSLMPQYHCHAIYAGSNKLPWYIEPHRTETNFLAICAAKGNPEP